MQGGMHSERARGEVVVMTSISFYLGNRRRVFAHPCYKMQGEQTEDHGDQTKKYVRRFAPNFLQKCLPTLAWNHAGTPVVLISLS